MTGGNSLQMAEQLKTEGIHDLRQSALLKVAQGQISLEEANRLT
jgi:type IV pilus assembly protein PilB